MSLFIQLYIARVGYGSGENFPDPAKIVRIRIRNSAEVGTYFKKNIPTFKEFIFAEVLGKDPYLDPDWVPQKMDE